jgi:hypothetical protein
VANFGRSRVSRGLSSGYKKQESGVNDEIQQIREKPFVAHPGPVSIDELLRNIDPAPDHETERFIAAIYAERGEQSRLPPACEAFSQKPE